ncbi:DUF4829 domain-containing protein [Clostridium sp. 19966]|uniref:DUF4829 domain-containing protein n=1 Tax=Clostridium sp. 19966 TaxID=2768166 RepID=UPI0028DF4CF7|nr:DUF4829 domain-containing protein [Clostridium sp. 19966]MDT8717656.1 DUF4829 domain-containing protein [Clostridium sp. 19966]
MEGIECDEAKNKEKLLTTLTDKWNTPNMVWRFYNLKSIKMISMKEDTSETAKIGYLKYGRGSINGATVYKNFIFTKRKDEAACQKLY